MHTIPSTLHALTASGARLAFRVRRVMEDMGLVPPCRIVIGFSGGADSTALTVLLRCLGFSLVLAHLDHQLRPESGREAELAQNFAGALGVACEVRAVAVREKAAAAGTGLEEAGRAARYAFFEDVRATLAQAPVPAEGLSGATREAWIATGHHLDDACEDVLLRLIRGTGWPALGGMEMMNPARHLVRPLLDIRHAELVDFLRAHHIPWVEDASNTSQAFRRNRVRHQLMPLLLAENPQFPEAVRQLRHMALDDAAHWDSVLAGLLATVAEQDGALYVPRSSLRDISRATRLRLFVRVVQRLQRGQARAPTLFALESLLGTNAKGGTGKVLQLPGGITVRLDKNHVVFA